MLYILYTSGTTASPRESSTPPAATWSAPRHAKWVFDLKDDDVFWCTADIGWVTGHSYIVYGPLANGATVVMYEGSPDWPGRTGSGRSSSSTASPSSTRAPTAIRAFMKWGDAWPAKHDLSSLRLLGSVGEPINPEAWVWYHEHIGGGRCPIVDTWWQTETGQILISPLPGVTVTKPGSATVPLPGSRPTSSTRTARRCPVGGGYLVLRSPWPSMLRGIYGDPERYQQTYWSRFPGRYFTGDGAKRDEEGYFWLLGRVDDVMNVGGTRSRPWRSRARSWDHPAVAEAAVVGKPDGLKGQAIIVFVTAQRGPRPRTLVRISAARRQGDRARSPPDTILFTADLPKTRSGKIMRRLLRRRHGADPAASRLTRRRGGCH